MGDTKENSTMCKCIGEGEREGVVGDAKEGVQCVPAYTEGAVRSPSAVEAGRIVWNKAVPHSKLVVAGHSPAVVSYLRRAMPCKCPGGRRRWEMAVVVNSCESCGTGWRLVGVVSGRFLLPGAVVHAPWQGRQGRHCFLLLGLASSVGRCAWIGWMQRQENSYAKRSAKMFNIHSKVRFVFNLPMVV